MNKATNPVLEVLRAASDAGIWLSKSDIWRNVQLLDGDQPAKNTVYRAFDDLIEYGFIDGTKVNTDEAVMFQITERGEEYLDGELDASKVEPADDE
jgi:DNA-binding PadR family transcriptional regulator